MQVYSVAELKEMCPVKWHDKIPKDGVSLGVADVDFNGPSGINNYLRDNLAEAYSFYQGKRGLPSALASIRHYLNSLGIRASNHNLQVIPGTMMGIYAAMKYASRRDGKILYAGPLYEPIHRHGLDNNNPVEFTNIDDDGLDHEMLKEKVTGAKMLAINNPSNPIGYVYTAEDLGLVRDVVTDNQLILFSDELYAPLIFERSKTDFTSAGIMEEISDRTILLFGFSKAYGLAGYRSGFMYCGDDLTEEMQFIIQSQLVSPNPLSSLVCSFALENESSKLWVNEFRSLMEQNTAVATKMFNEAGLRCKLPDSCFFVYPDTGVEDVQLCEELLEKTGVQVVPGSYFGPTGKNHIRVNCATSRERMEDGISRIISYF